MTSQITFFGEPEAGSPRPFSLATRAGGLVFVSGQSAPHDPAKGIVRGATTAQLDEVVADFERAARAAVAAGFDALEVHLGHNYLLSSFLSPNLNRRRDELGGNISALSQALARSARFAPAAAAPDEEVVPAAVDAIVGTFDPEWGGFGEAPKFPSTMAGEARRI